MQELYKEKSHDDSKESEQHKEESNSSSQSSMGSTNDEDKNKDERQLGQNDALAMWKAVSIQLLLPICKKGDYIIQFMRLSVGCLFGI